jgi:hypothetical protein
VTRTTATATASSTTSTSAPTTRRISISSRTRTVARSDNDQDGILDVDDLCPNDPEDKDGFEDEDGCPDLDNDKDRILDKDDRCPNEPETYNGTDDEDGCPDRGRVVVTDTKIEILDKVYFEYNKAIIKSESFPILDAVGDDAERQASS